MKDLILKILSVIFIIAGVVLSFFTSISESTVSSIVSGVLTLVGIIAGVFTMKSKKD